MEDEEGMGACASKELVDGAVEKPRYVCEGSVGWDESEVLHWAEAVCSSCGKLSVCIYERKLEAAPDLPAPMPAIPAEALMPAPRPVKSMLPVGVEGEVTFGGRAPR